MNQATRIALTALVPAVWGTTYYVSTQFLPPDHPWFAALMRPLPAGLIALAISRTLPRGAWWWKSLVLGSSNIGFFPLLFIAAGALPGGVAAPLGAGQPVFVAILAFFVLGEKTSGWRAAWTVLSILGVAMVVLGPAAAFSATGIAAGIAMAASMSSGVVLTKRWGIPAGVSPVALAGWQLTAGGLVLLVPALLIEGAPSHIDAPALGGYLWLGVVGTLVAYSVWFNNLQYLPVTATALLGVISPLVAALVGVVLNGESLNAIQVSGFILALLAMVAGQLSPQPLTSRRRAQQQVSDHKSLETSHRNDVSRLHIGGPCGDRTHDLRIKSP